MALMTLNDFLEDSQVQLYPADIDNTTKAVIKDWYGYRKVANNKYFPNWFYRTLVRDYPRYTELLRVEARTADSEYDWLVTNYEERQVERKGSGSDTIQGTLSKNGSNNRTFTAGQREVIVDNNSNTLEGETVSEHTGTEGNLLTRNLAHSDTERFVKDEDGTNNTLRTPNLTKTTNGTDELTENGSSNATRTPDLVNKTKGSGNDTSRHGILMRQAPYDADYPLLTPSLNANVTHNVGEYGVDMTGGEVENNSQFHAGFPALEIKNPTSATDELVDNANVTFSENEQTGTEQNDTTTELEREATRDETQRETGTETTNVTISNNADNTTTKNGTDTGTENNQRTQNLTDTDTTETTNTFEGRTERTKSGSDLDNTVLSETSNNNQTRNSSTNDLERTIFTGRSGQSPQFLLKDAVEFIKGTSAWLWLYRQLDKCFMMCYDLDEYEEV